MSKISLIAKLTAPDGKSEQLQAALVALIAAADEEEGLEVYSVHSDLNDGSVFYFFELYQNQGALDVHGQGAAMSAAMGALGGLLSGPPEITILHPLAAKGLEL